MSARKRPYPVAEDCREGLRLSMGLLRYIARNNELPKPANPEGMLNLLAGEAQRIEAILDGRDARVAFFQAEGQRNRRPQIGLDVAVAYHEHRMTVPPRSPLKPTRDYVRQKLKSKLTDGTIDTYQKKFRHQALDDLRMRLEWVNLDETIKAP